MSRSNTEILRCSFCRKSQDVVGKLISSPADYSRAYICDECVQKYTPEEQQYRRSGPVALPNRPSHCLMCHPDALQLLAVIERWALAERERGDSDPELAEVRRMARAMLGMGPT
jgi:ClpX C4-type zinc finger